MPQNHTTGLTIEVVPGRRLTGPQRRQVSALCTRAYGEDMEPLLRGFPDPTHVLGVVDGQLVSHALWVTRHLQPGALPELRTAYVEAVATDPAWRRRGFASALMRRVAAEVRAYDLAALSPFDVGYYARLGWEAWRGRLYVRTAAGRLASPESEIVMILRLPRTPPLDLTEPLSVEWRQGEIW